MGCRVCQHCAYDLALAVGTSAGRMWPAASCAHINDVSVEFALCALWVCSCYSNSMPRLALHCISLPTAAALPSGGTHVGDSVHRCWTKQRGLSGVVMGERVSGEAQIEILGLVQQANLGLNLTLPGNECPYQEKWCGGLPYAKARPDRGF
jgi:hypothetical protein